MNENMKEFGKKLPYFLGAFTAVIGCISGIGMALAASEFFAAICCTVATVAAFPTIKKWWKEVING